MIQKIKDLWATNKPLVIGIGVGVVAVIGGVIYFMTKGKKGTSRR